MRGGLVWILVLLAAVGAYLLFFADGPSGPPVGPGELGSGEEGPPPEDEKGPELLGSAGHGVRIPVAMRGRGTLQGLVRRSGAPTPADVELRHVIELDASNPFRGGFERLMIDRILDSGISSKPVIARTVAGGDGRYSFGGLAPGLYEVRARAEGGALGFASGMLPSHGARVAVDVDVPDGDATLRGRVVYADGKPYEGVVVAAAGQAFAVMMGAGGRVHPATTDAEGRFEIAGLIAGRYQVSAVIPGAMRVMAAPIEVPYAGEFLMTIDAAGITVSGRVISAATEEPVGGATVMGGGGNPESNFAIYSTTAGADGRFSIRVPAGRGGGMFVRAPGFATQTVEFSTTATDEVVVTLLRLGTVSGRVLAQDGGTPVSGANVYAVTSGQGMGFGGSMNGAVSASDGTYRIEGVSPGAVKLHVLGAGWASVGLGGSGFVDSDTPYVVELEPGAAVERDLEVVAAGRVKGRVLGADGRPVPGAVVQAGGPGEAAQMISALMGMGIAFASAVSDADGAYAIDALVPGSEYQLAAKAPEHPDASSARFRAASGKEEVQDITFAAARWVEVRVRAAAGGGPIAGATVAARPPTEGDRRIVVDDFFGLGASWTTDGQGNARIGPLPEGELEIVAVASGYLQGETALAAGQAGPLEVALTKGLVIAGRVQVPEGIPPQSLRVTVRRDGRGGGWFRERAIVDPEGRWRLDTLESAGEYRISAEGSWSERSFSGAAVAQAGDEDVVIEIREQERSERERIEISVLDADGKPVPTGRVELTRYYGPQGNSSSSSSSRINSGKAVLRGFELDGELWVEVRDVIGAARAATILGPVTVAEGRLEVRLPTARVIAGVVVDGAGRGVAGVKVEARPVHPRSGEVSRWQSHGSAVTDGDGRFAIQGLGPLEYRLVVGVPVDYAPAAPQTVQAGDRKVRIELQAGVRARLTLLDGAGQPVAGAQASLQPVEAESGASTWNPGVLSSSDTRGALVLGGLKPGVRFHLTLSPPERRTDLRPITLRDWTPADATLTFEPGFTIEGSLRDQKGRQVDDVYLHYRKVGAEDWQWNEVQEDGSFVIRQLGAGEYELRAQASGVTRMSLPRAPGEPPAPEPGIVRARSGATGVRIVVDVGETLRVKILRLPAAPPADPDMPPEYVWAGRRTAWLRSGEAGHFAQIQGRWRAHDTLEFRGLQPERAYSLWVGGLEGGHYVQVGGVRAQEELTVEAKKGGEIAGRVKLPAGVEARTINVHGHAPGGEGTNAHADPKTGQFTLEGLPPGEWTITVTASDGSGTRYQASAQARTGASLVLEVQKE